MPYVGDEGCHFERIACYSCGHFCRGNDIISLSKLVTLSRNVFVKYRRYRGRKDAYHLCKSLWVLTEVERFQVMLCGHEVVDRADLVN
jgi:hypothetical protein